MKKYVIGSWIMVMAAFIAVVVMAQNSDVPQLPVAVTIGANDSFIVVSPNGQRFRITLAALQAQFAFSAVNTNIVYGAGTNTLSITNGLIVKIQ